MIVQTLSSFLGGVLTPLALLFCSAGVLSVLGPKRVFLPFRSSGEKSGTEAAAGSRTSPFAALTVALAGTLGVGNITGVASALFVGGPGAIFWMWVGALAVIPVKYAEVWLAVRYRRRGRNGYYGGSMYVIRDGLGAKLPGRAGIVLGGFFALLCALNALVTGCLVQANAAVSALGPPEPRDRFAAGTALSLLVLGSVLFGTKKIERITSAVIPSLSVLYIAACLAAILPRLGLMPGVLRLIVTSAFSPRAAGGAALGFSAREALRFGVMRGIFSNEAGCGTSPTAHASADTPSASRQASLGTAEVVFDTLILCSLTAFVLLLADAEAGLLPRHVEADAAPVVFEAFRILAGKAFSFLVRLSVPLFAYSSVIAQFYYGSVAVGYLTKSRAARPAFAVLTALFSLLGAAAAPGAMWTAADLLLGLMTVFNCSVLFVLRKTPGSAEIPRSHPRPASRR